MYGDHGKFCKLSEPNNKSFMQIPFEAHSVLRCNDDPLYTVTSRRPSPDHLHAWPLSRQYFPIRQRINLTDAMRSNRVPLLKALVPRNDGCEVDEKTKTYGEASVSSFPCAWHWESHITSLSHQFLLSS